MFNKIDAERHPVIANEFRTLFQESHQLSIKMMSSFTSLRRYFFLPKIYQWFPELLLSGTFPQLKITGSIRISSDYSRAIKGPNEKASLLED